MKDLRKKAIFLLFFALLAEGRAEAEAEAQAQPEADPQAEAQFGGRPPYNPGGAPPLSRPPYNPGGGYPPYNPGRPDYFPGGDNLDPGFGRPDFGYNPDPGFGRPDYGFNPDPGFDKPDPGFGRPDTCGLTEQCCNMANENCCLKNEQKCYTVWDRQCDQETNLWCPVQVQQFCKNVVIPDCRIKKEVSYRTFSTDQCTPVPGKHCFKYQAKVCNTDMIDENVEVKWQNQKLKLLETTKEKKCVPIETKECTNQTYSETINIREPRVQTINETKVQCRYERVQTPGKQVVQTVWQTVSRPVCYDMPVPICTQTPCANNPGQCESGTSPCSNNNFNTATVCPQQASGATGMPSVAMGGCQEVQQPVCNNNGGMDCGGPNFQQCCRMSSRKVCKNILQRVPKQVTQTLPGGWNYVQKCEPMVIPRTVTQYVNVPKTVQRVKYNCKKVVKNECFDYDIPKYDVITEDVEDDVTIELPKCSEKTETREQCVNVPDMNTDCRTSTVRKAIVINKIICDRQRTTQICHKIPVSQCVETGMPNCRMVPRQVCQNVCSQSNYCNTCNEFVSGTGFGNCPTANCGQYIGGMMGLNDTMGMGVGGPAPGGAMYPYGEQISLVDDDFSDDIFN